MLKDKVFGAFDSDLEFRMVHLAMSPLYSESFDPNAALQSCLNNVYNAESHSKAYSSIWRLLYKANIETQMTYTRKRKSTLITERTCIKSRQRLWSSWATRTGSALPVSKLFLS